MAGRPVTRDAGRGLGRPVTRPVSENLDPFGALVAVYNEKTKQWDIYARVVERMRTRRYKVKTVYGTILSRNRKHLRPRTAYSIPVSGRGEDTRGATEQDNSEPLTNKPEARAPQNQMQDTRRSSRARKKPTRLIEDHSWH